MCNGRIPWELIKHQLHGKIFWLFGLYVAAVATELPLNPLDDSNKWHTFQCTDKFDLDYINDE